MESEMESEVEDEAEDEEQSDGEGEEQDEGEGQGQGSAPPAPDPADVERLSGLRKGLKIFEERFVGEHGRKPSGSDDIPFHVRVNYREYHDLKAKLAGA